MCEDLMHLGLTERKSKTILLPKVPKKYFPDFYQKNLELTKLAIKKSVSEDNFIIQAIANINELDKASNLLTKRLREWYGLYFPELEQKISSPEKLVELILTKERKELLKELSCKNCLQHRI